MSWSKKSVQKTLSFAIILLSLTLIIGRHFDARWAGGEGYRSRTPIITEVYDDRPDAVCAPVDPSRVNILTCKGERRKFTFGQSTIWMDENAAIVVVNDREGSEQLSLHGGRIIVRGPVVISVREHEFRTDGTMMVVHYGWLQHVDVFMMDGAGTETLDAASTTLDSQSAMSFDTVLPYDAPKAIPFASENESVIEFTAWAAQ